jgi:hypothetical protein
MKDPADKVTIDTLLPMPQLKPQTWEEAMDQLADEKQMLWDALDNIVTLWEMEASMSDIENSVARARILLASTAPEEETT